MTIPTRVTIPIRLPIPIEELFDGNAYKAREKFFAFVARSDVEIIGHSRESLFERNEELFRREHLCFRGGADPSNQLTLLAPLFVVMDIAFQRFPQE